MSVQSPPNVSWCHDVQFWTFGVPTSTPSMICRPILPKKSVVELVKQSDWEYHLVPRFSGTFQASVILRENYSHIQILEMKIGFQTPCEAILLGLHLLLQVILTRGLYADRARLRDSR